ncbi:MAG TPA: hypothetical protein DEA50_14635, partial [Parvularcula sp.]|nr:hypothetical protein [Parvularcula sp.]
EDWRALAAALMALHYDPLYARARRRGPAPVATVKIDRLDSDEIERAAALIVDLTRVVGVPLL